jgi:DNA-directed RNA polymerase subunit RPC12/RpoP
MRTNNETKSIAYAFVANGVQIYLGDKDDQFITSKLICSDCGGPWYMNLTECFLCGAINKFLYRCSSCGKFISITNSSRACGNCGSKELYMVCPNEECISNKDVELSKEINQYGGVFNKESGFLISQQYCLYCGSQSHMYKNYTIRVITTTSDVLSMNEIDLNSQKLESNPYLVIRRKREEKISYGVYKRSESNEESIELKDLYDNFTKVVESLYPIKRRNGNN